MPTPGPNRLAINCPAKINLWLRVFNKREDGYHNVESLFQAIAIFDRLTATVSVEMNLECYPPVTQSPQENLVLKAANLLKSKYPDNPNISFSMQKTIPPGAGLGGGSSDAAGALLLCNEIWKLNLGVQKLQSISAEIGADVPFFIRSRTQLATGMGEKLQPVSTPYSLPVLVATPKVFISTQEAYNAIHPRLEVSSFSTEFEAKRENIDLYAKLHNDFENWVLGKYPIIRSIQDEIKSFRPLKALLCGSGASLFAVFPEAQVAEKCRQAIHEKCRFSALTGFHLHPPQVETLEVS